MRASFWPLSSLILVSCQSSDKTITVSNTRPVVTIEEPNEAEVFEVGDAITFVAYVEDKESAVEDLDLEWISDLAGLLEEDTVPSSDGEVSFSTSGLAEGLHTVTLKATDPGGQIGTDYMTVVVEFNCLEYTDCDYDADGFTEDDGDCNDNNPGIHPGAVEVLNGVDDDCDGVIDEGTAVFDDDGDGFNEYMGDCDDDDPEIAPMVVEVIDGIDNDCDGIIDEETDTYDDDGDGYSEADGDCDDDDADIGPHAEEVLNGVDDDCDGFVDEGSEAFDDDRDGYSEFEGDCDDTDAAIHPDAVEVCDEIDNDCDGYIDGEDADTDLDGDGFSGCSDDCDDDDPEISPLAIELEDEIDNDCDDIIDEETDVFDDDGDGYSEADGDCDDDDDDIGPHAEEVLNGVDDDCDGLVDEGSEAFDDDGDGYTEFAGDCDDSDPSIHPGATEVCDEIDNDCDDDIDDEDSDTDLDGDGFSGCNEDCNDDDEDIHPDAAEVCDDIDNDCDDDIDADDADTDVDGDGFSVCPSADGVVDCDDLDRFIHPDRSEMCGDGLDNDCDGDVDEMGGVGGEVFYADRDGDGFGDPASILSACSLPAGYVLNADDCDDSSSAIKPTAVEVCDGADNDCDGAFDEDSAVDASTWYYDGDGDGYGSTAAVACDRPSDYYVLDSGDCNDEDTSAYPGATEVCDGVLNDCTLSEADGAEAVDRTMWYLDDDGDGYPRSDASVESCDAPADYVAEASDWDCNDEDEDVNPGEDEQCDEKDNDCDTVIDEEDALGCTDYYADVDEDGFGVGDSACLCEVDETYTAEDDGDCSDADGNVNPSVTDFSTEERDDGGFDFNCDDEEEKEFTGVADVCSILGCVTFTEGWENTEQECGETGVWISACVCSYFYNDEGELVITPETVSAEQQQACR